MDMRMSVVMELGLPRVLEYYSSNLLLLEYSLISISGWKFPFPVAVFCSQLTVSPSSVLRVAPAGRKTSKSASKLLKYQRFPLRAMLPVTILMLTHQSTTPSSSLAVCIKVLPVLTSARVLVMYSDEYSSRKLLVSGSPKTPKWNSLKRWRPYAYTMHGHVDL